MAAKTKTKDISTTSELAELEGLVKEPDRSKHPYHTRFSDAVWYDPDFIPPIYLGGAGGIGSWLAPLLARAGYALVIYDNDTIDETNMAGQLYMKDAIGQNKASTVVQMCQLLGGQKKNYALQRYAETSSTAKVTISAFDNMAARKLMFQNWKKQEDRLLFIDGRMLAESGQIYFVQKGDEEAYETQLFDDKEVQEQPCSMKATSHCGAHIASVMMTGLTNFISNQKLGADMRDVPFKLEFELPLLMWTTKTKEQCQTLLTKTPES